MRCLLEFGGSEDGAESCAGDRVLACDVLEQSEDPIIRAIWYFELRICGPGQLELRHQP